jgi:hypothetical protein
MIIIVYCFVRIDTYVGEEPPQYNEEIDETTKQHPIHRPDMPCWSNQRVRNKVTDHICALLAR